MKLIELTIAPAHGYADGAVNVAFVLQFPEGAEVDTALTIEAVLALQEYMAEYYEDNLIEPEPALQEVEPSEPLPFVMPPISLAIKAVREPFEADTKERAKEIWDDIVEQKANEAVEAIMGPPGHVAEVFEEYNKVRAPTLSAASRLPPPPVGHVIEGPAVEGTFVKLHEAPPLNLAHDNRAILLEKFREVRALAKEMGEEASDEVLAVIDQEGPVFPVTPDVTEEEEPAVIEEPSAAELLASHYDTEGGH